MRKPSWGSAFPGCRGIEGSEMLMARMTEPMFGEEGVDGPDIRARIPHQSSLFVFEERGGRLPRKRPTPQVRSRQPA